MKTLKSVLAVTLVAVSLSGGAIAQTISYGAYMMADHTMRSSKLIGMPIYNEHNEKIGTIDEVLLPVGGGEPSAVLSVGNWLGAGDKMVKVPLNHIHFTSAKPEMPASKAALMAMPDYSYAQSAGG